VNGITNVRAQTRYLADGTDLEGTMRKTALLLAVIALCLGIVEVWTGGSRTETTENSAVFVISNAL
jgi:hypothetical protein